MPSKLKTYVTTSGFFELAVAAPSMKAAIAIWGASPDLFQRGYAKASDDAAVVRATMAKPGTVLKRAVGSRGPFRENPSLASVGGSPQTKRRPQAKPAPPAARLYEAAQQKREREKARAESRETKRREQLVRKAEAALARAQDRHEERMAAIDEQREALERRASVESERWENEKRTLEAALRKARD